LRYHCAVSPAHRRFLLLEEGVGAGIVNLLLNGAIALLLFRGMTAVPLWGPQSIAGDTVGTTFLLPLLTTLIVTPLARGAVRAGRFEPLVWTRDVPAVLRCLPSGTFVRGCVLGLLCTAIVAPLGIGALAACGVAEQTLLGFVAFKALFAGGLAALVTPAFALLAIAKR